MAKFAAGDTVIGNAQNCHGVTGEDCVLTVTRAGATAFSGIIDEHPDDSDHEGETHDGLRYEWFDLQESASDIVASACSAAQEPRKRFTPLDYVSYCGEKVRVLGYEDYDDWSGHQVEIMYEDNETEVVDESDLETWVAAPTKPAYQPYNGKPITHRAEEMPKDYKTMNRVREVIVVVPAHKAEPIIRKTPPKVQTKPLQTDRFDKAFDPIKTRRRGHTPLRTDN